MSDLTNKRTADLEYLIENAHERLEIYREDYCHHEERMNKAQDEIIKTNLEIKNYQNELTRRQSEGIV